MTIQDELAAATKRRRSPSAGRSANVWLVKATQAAVEAAATANGLSVTAQLKRIVDSWASTAV